MAPDMNKVKNSDADHHVETSPNDRYIRYEAVLGKGAYKTVYKAFDTEEALEVAWNKLHVDRLSEHDLEKVSNEVSLLRLVEHKNIIHFYETWRSEEPNGTQTINFITEQMMSGTLKEYLKKAKAIKLKVIRRWCRNILEAIAYLHSRQPPIMHRDLKCDNIFINGHVGEVKIGDLGLSGVKSRDKAESVIGTPEFMAPELYEESYTEKVDIYAFGMCLLEMVTMEYPYSECTNMAQIFKKVFQGEKPRAFSMLEDGPVKEVIAECLRREEQRPSAARLLEHPLFKEWELDEGKSSNLSLVKGSPNAVETAIETAISTMRASNQMPIGTEVIDWSDPLNRNVFVSMVQGDQEHGNNDDISVRATKDQQGGAFVMGVQIPFGDAVKRVEFSFDPFADSPEHIAQEMIAEFDLGVDKLPMIQEEIVRQVLVAKRQRAEASRNATPQPPTRQLPGDSNPPHSNESSLHPHPPHSSHPLTSPNAQPGQHAPSIPPPQALPPPALGQSLPPVIPTNPPNVSMASLEQTLASSSQNASLSATTEGHAQMQTEASPLVDTQFVRTQGQSTQGVAASHPNAHPTETNTSQQLSQPFEQPQTNDPNNSFVPQYNPNTSTPAVPNELQSEQLPPSTLHDMQNLPLQETEAQAIVQPPIVPTSQHQHSAPTPQSHPQPPPTVSSQPTQVQPPVPQQPPPVPPDSNPPPDMYHTQPAVIHSDSLNSENTVPAEPTRGDPSSQSSITIQHEQQPMHQSLVMSESENVIDPNIDIPVLPPSVLQHTDGAAPSEIPPMSMPANIESLPTGESGVTASHATEISNPSEIVPPAIETVVKESSQPETTNIPPDNPPPAAAPVPAPVPAPVQAPVPAPVPSTAPIPPPAPAAAPLPAPAPAAAPPPVPPPQVSHQPELTAEQHAEASVGQRAVPDVYISVQPQPTHVPHSVSDSQLRNTKNSHIGATELPPRPPSTPITPDASQPMEAAQRLKKSASEVHGVGRAIDNESRHSLPTGFIPTDTGGSASSELSQGHSRPSSASIPAIVVVRNQSDSSTAQHENQQNADASSVSDGVVESSHSLQTSTSREHIERGNMTNRVSPQNVDSQSYPASHSMESSIAGRISPEHHTPTSGQMKGTSWRSVQSVDTTATAASKENKKSSDTSDSRNDNKALTKCLKLMDFCARGRYEDVKNALLNGALTRFQDYDHRTPLHVAASGGHLNVVALLIENGAEISAKNRWGNTALSIARENEHHEIVKMLKQYGAEDDDVDVENLEFLHYCAVGDVDAVRNLINGGAQASLCDYEKRTPLHLACSEGHVNVAELLLINGASFEALDRKKRTPVQDAISNGRRNILRLLARHGAQLPPHLYQTDEEQIRRLGMELIESSARGDVARVQECLEHGADLNFSDYDSRTALHLACVDGQEEVVDILLQSGARLDVRDRWGSLPIDEAISSNKDSIVTRIREIDSKRRQEIEASGKNAKESNMTDVNGHGGRSADVLGMHFPGGMSMNSIHFSTDDFADKPSIALSGSMEQVSTPMPSLPITPFEATGNDGSGSQQVERRIQELGQGQGDGDYVEVDPNSMSHGWPMDGEVGGAYGVRQVNEKVEGGDAAARNSIDGNFTLAMSEMPRLVEQIGLSGEDARDNGQVAYSSSMVSMSSISNGVGLADSRGLRGMSNFGGSPIRGAGNMRIIDELVEGLVDAAVRKEH